MCGLIVFVSTQSPADAVGRSAFADALATMHHRGPDDTTVESTGAVMFGFKRLSIVALDTGRQPVRYPASGPDAERWTAIFNGEIYNYRELREELQREHGAQFTTQSEVEVIAAAFRQWGPSALHRLRGMFSIAVWDAASGTLYAARDPFGIKPLYYLHTADGLFLASEKKALSRFVGNAPVDTTALSHYLTLQYVPEPATLTPQIRRLEPGGLLTYRPDGGQEPQVERYFRPRFRPTPTDPATAIGAIRDALRDSVRQHLHAEVPVGAFLSSGVDSTAIVALAREVDPKIHAYTVGFADTGYSEVEVAQETADSLGVALTPTFVTAEEVMEELPRIVWHLDDPVADPALVPLYFLARRAAQDVTVVLSGEGADELFAGYRIYREPASLAGVGRLPAPLRRGLRALSGAIPEGVKGKSFLERATTPIEDRYYGNARIFSPAEKARLLRVPAVPHTLVTEAVYAEAADLDDVATMQLVDIRTWLPGDILTKADRMSMAHSLELRVPFLDRAVYAAAATLSTELKLPARSRSTKYALREAVRGIVPDFVVDRPKLGFPTPTRIWLRGALGVWAGDMIAGSGTGHLLDLNYAQQLLAEHRRGEADNSRKVWTVLMFCLWYAQQGRPAPAAKLALSG